MFRQFLIVSISMCTAIIGCQKKTSLPHLFFNHNKATYGVGDTIKCTYDIPNNYILKWSSSDGNYSNLTFFNCYIDSALEDGTFSKTIELKIYDQSNNFIGSSKKVFPIHELILPTDFYTLFQPATAWSPPDTTKIIPTHKTTEFLSGYFYINVRKGVVDTHRDYYNNHFRIRLTHQPTTNETFTLKPDNVTLTNNEASLSTYFYGKPLHSLEGELDIKINHRGKIRAIFNEARFDTYHDTLNWKMSADLTCH